MIDKEKGNLALKEIINSELEENPLSIAHLNKLLYEIKKDFPHIPTIENLINSARLEMITLASKNYYRRIYFKTLGTAISYLELVFKNIKKNHHTNVTDYFDILEIYKETHRRKKVSKLIDKEKGSELRNE